jgi:hypothetical protein
MTAPAGAGPPPSTNGRAKISDPIKRYGEFLRTLEIRPAQLFGLDFVVGLAGGVGGGFLDTETPTKTGDMINLSAALIGVVIAAVIAGAAIIAAFLDQELLRKLKEIDLKPQRYLTPFIVTAFIGLASMLLLLGLYGDPSKTAGASEVLAGFAGLGVVWTITSLGGALKMIVDFADLKRIAAERTV